MFKIIRFSQSRIGTHGVLLKGELPLCVTLELPWKDNKRNESCIPEGVYYCEKGLKYVRVNGVNSRSGILIHSGNTTSDTSGCILVGQQFSPLGIVNSKYALEDFLKAIPDTFKLTIERS